MSVRPLALLGFGLRVSGAVLRRPHLAPTAVQQVRRLAAPGWWRRPPFLPVPASDYLRFRQVTATGSGDGVPAVDDVITWLEWCREMQLLTASR